MPESPFLDLCGLERLDRAFRRGSPVFHGVVGRAWAELGSSWGSEVDEAVRRLFPDEEALDASVNGYCRFARDLLRLQLRFEKELAYAPKTYAQAHEQTYSNQAYMQTQYLPGLLLSHFLWPHHHRQRLFFEQAFLSAMRRAGATSFCEVGVGTGYYSRVALSVTSGVHGVGYDISPSSCAFAQWHVGAYGMGSRFGCELRDVVADPPGPTDWLVCVELLEHLEDPLRLLHTLRAMLRPTGKAFVTTALNAANPDHIFLYRTPGEVRAQLEAAGFVVEQYLSAFAGKPSSPGAPVAEVTAFVVR